jgi:hypothetical protein
MVMLLTLTIGGLVPASAADFEKLASQSLVKIVLEDHSNAMEDQKADIEFLKMFAEYNSQGKLSDKDFIFLVKGRLSVIEAREITNKSRQNKLQEKILQLPDDEVRKLFYWINDVYAFGTINENNPFLKEVK